MNLAHNTEDRWAETRPVTLGELQSSDLVLLGESGPTSHHLGLYIGYSMMINVRQMGAFVRYDSIYWFDAPLPFAAAPHERRRGLTRLWRGHTNRRV